MKAIDKIGLILLAGGALLMVLGVARQFWRARGKFEIHESNYPAETVFQPHFSSSGGKFNRNLILLIFILIFASAAFLRLDGLADKSLSHPEIYVPGIELPVGISEPPPRTTLVPLLWFHFHGEPHPPGYYFLMFGWTKIFGTTVFALRLPSVIFGLLSVILVFVIGRELFNHQIGLIGAALLAFSGHQIYWSQTARMYTMTCFLGLLATFSLIKILSDKSSSQKVWGAVYLIAAIIGVYTEILFWALLAGQIIFAIARKIFSRLCETHPNSPDDYLLSLQSIAIICGAPMWAHAVYTGRSSPLEPLSASFFGEFIAFGFAFERDNFSFPARSVPDLCLALLAGLAVICLAAAFIGFNQSLQSGQLRRCLITKSKSIAKIPPSLQLKSGFIAFASIITVLGFDLLAAARHEKILLTCLVAVAGYYLPTVSSWLIPLLETRKTKVQVASVSSDGRFLLLLLSFLPALLVTLVSLFNSLLASRLFLVFTPYLLLLYAVGIWHLIHRSLLFGLFLIPVICLICALSVSYYKFYPTDVFDYRDLAEKINLRAQNGDMVLVHKRRWVTTPIFYYLDSHKLLITAENTAQTVTDRAMRRVWLVNFQDQPLTQEMINATEDFHKSNETFSRRSSAVLYER